MGEDIWHLISGLVAIETFPVCVGVVIGVGANAFGDGDGNLFESHACIDHFLFGALVA